MLKVNRKGKEAIRMKVKGVAGIKKKRRENHERLTLLGKSLINMSMKANVQRDVTSIII